MPAPFDACAFHTSAVQPGALVQMHTLRTEALFALRDAPRRRRLCGVPWQSAEHEQLAARGVGG